MGRSGEPRLARSNEGDAVLRVPDQLRVALRTGDDDRHVLVVRPVRVVAGIPREDRVSRCRLLRRQDQRHVRHIDVPAELHRSAHAGQVNRQGILFRAEGDVPHHARVVGVDDRSGERVAAAVDGQVRVAELERRVAQVGVAVQRQRHSHLIRILSDRVQHRRARIDDAVPVSESPARGRRRAVAQEPDVRLDRQRVAVEALGERHASLVVVAGHIRHVEEGRALRQLALVRIGEADRLVAVLTHDVHERDRHGLALDVVQVHAERSIRRVDRQAAIGVAQAVRRNLDVVADHLHAGTGQRPAVHVDVAPDAAAERRVRDRDRRAARDVERVEIARRVEGQVGDRDRRAVRDLRPAGERISAVQRQALVDRHALHNVREQRYGIAALRRPRESIRQRRVDRGLVRRSGETRLARPDEGDAVLRVPDQLRVTRRVGDDDRHVLMLRAVRVPCRIPREHRVSRRSLLLREDQRHVRHIDIRAEAHRARHLCQVDRQRSILRAERDVPHHARIVGVDDRSDERVAAAVDGQVGIAELKRGVAQVGVAVQRQLDRHFARILIEGFQHSRARVDDPVPVADSPAGDGRIGVAKEPDIDAQRQRVAAEPRRQRHARQGLVARHIRHVEDGAGLRKRISIGIAKRHRIRAVLAHDVHEGKFQRFARDVPHVQTPRGLVPRQRLAAIGEALPVGGNNDRVADHRHARAGQRTVVHVYVAPEAAAEGHVRHLNSRASRDVERVEIAGRVERHIGDHHRSARVNLRPAGDRVLARQLDALIDRHALHHVRQQLDRVFVIGRADSGVQRLVLADEIKVLVIHSRHVCAALDRVVRLAVNVSRLRRWDVTLGAKFLKHRFVEPAAADVADHHVKRKAVRFVVNDRVRTRIDIQGACHDSRVPFIIVGHNRCRHVAHGEGCRTLPVAKDVNHAVACERSVGDCNSLRSIGVVAAFSSCRNDQAIRSECRDIAVNGHVGKVADVGVVIRPRTDIDASRDRRGCSNRAVREEHQRVTLLVSVCNDTVQTRFRISCDGVQRTV